jgi:monovalent cation:H+ antiporter, CPA1 family
MGGSSFALLVEGGGGIVLGLTTGFVASFLMRHIKDDVGVMTISLALTLSTYRLAVAFGISGPLAVVVCGLMLADKLAAADTDNGERERLIALWSVVEGLLNTLLFMLMGFEVLAMDLSAFMVIPVLAAIPLAFLSRFISVGAALSLLRFAPGNKLQATSLLTWVGLRGAVSVALVLTLPEGPYTNVLSAACYAVVIFTVVVQGLLTPRVVAALYPTARASA